MMALGCCFSLSSLGSLEAGFAWRGGLRFLLGTGGAGLSFLRRSDWLAPLRFLAASERVAVLATVPLLLLAGGGGGASFAWACCLLGGASYLAGHHAASAVRSAGPEALGHGKLAELAGVGSLSPDRQGLAWLLLLVFERFSWRGASPHRGGGKAGAGPWWRSSSVVTFSRVPSPRGSRCKRLNKESARPCAWRVVGGRSPSGIRCATSGDSAAGPAFSVRSRFGAFGDF